MLEFLVEVIFTIFGELFAEALSGIFNALAGHFYFKPKNPISPQQFFQSIEWRGSAEKLKGDLFKK